MEANFWHDLWDKGDTGWHLEDTNEHLVKHYSKLELEKGSRVLVPLCGKTVDIKWLLERGNRVVGVELNEDAIKSLFEHLATEPTVNKVGSFTVYSANNIDIFVGNIFELNQEILGEVDCVYDRGALVALPSDMRENYTKLLIDITKKAPQLIICFDYDQNKMDGPPFSINESLLKNYYEDVYSLKLLDSVDVEFFDDMEVVENVWFIK